MHQHQHPQIEKSEYDQEKSHSQIADKSMAP